MACMAYPRLEKLPMTSFSNSYSLMATIHAHTPPACGNTTLMISALPWWLMTLLSATQTWLMPPTSWMPCMPITKLPSYQDCDATQYCDLTLKWDYDQWHVDISMPGYIEHALLHFCHPHPMHPEHAPHTWQCPTYGVKV